MRLHPIAAVVLVAAALPAAGQQPASQLAGRMAFVNTERIMNESEPAKRLQVQIENEFRAREQEVAALGERIKRAQQEMERNAVTMSDVERQQRERELGELGREVERKQRLFAEDLQTRKNEASAQVVTKANAVIKRLAAELKLDLIFQDAIYASPRIDITDRVIKELGAESK